MGHFQFEAQNYIFTVYHLNKWMIIHEEGCFIPYDDILHKAWLVIIKITRTYIAHKAVASKRLQSKNNLIYYRVT